MTLGVKVVRCSLYDLLAGHKPVIRGEEIGIAADGLPAGIYVRRGLRVVRPAGIVPVILPGGSHIVRSVMIIKPGAVGIVQGVSAFVAGILSVGRKGLRFAARRLGYGNAGGLNVSNLPFLRLCGFHPCHCISKG